ncbi:MAG: prolyl oligopeptidase family serine peptidase [Planctomycetaceae bacterium]
MAFGRLLAAAVVVLALPVSGAPPTDPSSLVRDPAAAFRWTGDSTLVIGPGGKDGYTEEINAVSGNRRALTREEAKSLGFKGLEPTPMRSWHAAGETTITFRNELRQAVEIVWVDAAGDRHEYGRLGPGEHRRQHTFAGHAWVVMLDGRTLGWVRGESSEITVSVATVEGPPLPEPPVGGQESAEDGTPRADPPKRTLPTAAAALAGPHEWSPDGRFVVGWEVVEAQSHPVHIVESSPRDRVEPRLRTIQYLKPGDRIEQRWPRLFTSDGREIPLDRSLFANPWSIDRLDWRDDSTGFSFVFNQRGHQVVRLLAVDASDGEVRRIVEESSRTFIDYAHKTWMHALPGGEWLWMSERSGWNHLYLLDPAGEESPRPITCGGWMVRRVEEVDPVSRTVRLVAMGIDGNQDPYHEHVLRVAIDDGSVVRLTEGDGTHQLSWSPDGRYYVDTFSRVDLPPVHELRRSTDGTLVCELGRADASALVASGWVMPERFVTTGRDGATPIHGVIWRPNGAGDDPRPLPIVEDVYAGPHGFHVPKAFATSHRQRTIADAGFVVVAVDGMGTNWRGKAFHDVCWKNLRDAGFPDRVEWLRSAATTRPWMDLARVGIVGGSAGGQNAVRALIDHSDVYSVAVADCGCHDNRMDKIWWNELWMGWPVDEAYEKCSNVLDAHRLVGRLMLIVGEIDENVDPSSTLQMSSALVRAGIDHELVVIPGAGHGAAETAYGSRKRLEFLLEHLAGRRSGDH